MNKPLSVDQQVRAMIDSLSDARMSVRGRSNVGVQFLVKQFRPAPPVFWRLVKIMTDYR